MVDLMKRLLLVLAVALSLGRACLGAGGEAVELKVMTYNIGAASPIPLGLPEIAKIAEQIKAENVDIVGLQEVDLWTNWEKWRSGLDMIGELSIALAKIGYPMHHYYSPTLRYHEGWMNLCIFSRYPILDSGYTFIHPEGTRGWKAIYVTVEPQRGVRRTTEPENAVPLHFFTSHYCIGGQGFPFHKEQTDRLLAFAAKFKGARILTGDFNLTPDSPYYKQILDAGYRESCEAVGGGHRFTVGSGAGIVAPEPKVMQIDFVFGTPDIEFLDTYVPKSTISDHWPLVAKIRIGPKQ